MLFVSLGGVPVWRGGAAAAGDGQGPAPAPPDQRPRAVPVPGGGGRGAPVLHHQRVAAGEFVCAFVLLCPL